MNIFISEDENTSLGTIKSVLAQNKHSALDADLENLNLAEQGPALLIVNWSSWKKVENISTSIDKKNNLNAVNWLFLLTPKELSEFDTSAKPTHFDFAVKPLNAIDLRVRIEKILGTHSSSSSLPLNVQRQMALKQIFAGLAHDINNPLAIACGTSQQLSRLTREGTLTPTQCVPMLGRMDRSLDRITQLVKGLGLLTQRPTTSGDECREGPFGKLMENVLPFYHERFQKSGIEFKVDIHMLEPKVKCPPLLISQTLLCLLHYAQEKIMENAPTEKWIELKTQEKGSDLQVLVSFPTPANAPASPSPSIGMDFVKNTIGLYGSAFQLEEDGPTTKISFALPIVS